MYHNKLKNIQILELLQQLTEREISNFVKFLRSRGANDALLICLSHLIKSKIKDPEDPSRSLSQPSLQRCPGKTTFL
jgi:hypothetical protein